jgi:hypothetical protein
VRAYNSGVGIALNAKHECAARGSLRVKTAFRPCLERAIPRVPQTIERTWSDTPCIKRIRPCGSNSCWAPTPQTPERFGGIARFQCSWYYAVMIDDQRGRDGGNRTNNIMRQGRHLLRAAILFLGLSPALSQTAPVYSVRNYGAKGDGRQ